MKESLKGAKARFPNILLLYLDATPPPTDSELMARARTGDRLAFEEIYSRYEGRVYAYLWRLVRDEAVAADLRQDAFLRLWQARKDWKGGGSVAGYLIRAARNLAIDAHRRRRLHHRWQEETMSGPQAAALAPDAVLAQEGLEARVNAAVEALPERPREVFILKRDAGFSYREISELLGISTKTVEVHMGKALRLLRVALADLRDSTERS